MFPLSCPLQLVDQLCSRSHRRPSGSLSAATAPAGMRAGSGAGGGGGAASVASPSHAVASAGMARMVRLSWGLRIVHFL